MRSAISRRPTLRISLLTVALLCSACTTWEPYRTPAAAPVPERALGSVRITRQDFSTLVLHDAWVAGDTLRGTTPRGYSTPGAETAMPLADVRFVERRRVDVGRTALLLAAPPAIFVAFLLASFPHGDF